MTNQNVDQNCGCAHQYEYEYERKLYSNSLFSSVHRTFAIFKIILNAINFAHWICKELLLENIQHFQKQSTKSKCTNKIFDSNSERGWMIYQLYQTNTSFPNIYFLKLSIIPKVHPKILLKMQQSTGYINTPWQTVSMKERFFFSVEFYLYLLNVYTQILL